MGTILDIRGLTVFYGVHEAVCGVDMQIDEGNITAIIGSNGAGKTTIINAISGPAKVRFAMRAASSQPGPIA